jgi:hypothetical protein
MNSRFIIIAILISIKVIGIASSAKAEINIKKIYTNYNKYTCQGLPCSNTWNSHRDPFFNSHIPNWRYKKGPRDFGKQIYCGLNFSEFYLAFNPGIKQYNC